MRAKSKYSGVQMIDGIPHIWLQSYGMQKAIQATELKPGMIRLYNFGCTGEIKTVEIKNNMVHVEVIESGEVYNTKYRANSYIPIQ